MITLARTFICCQALVWEKTESEWVPAKRRLVPWGTVGATKTFQQIKRMMQQTTKLWGLMLLAGFCNLACYAKLKNLSSYIHPHVNLYMYDFLSSAQKKIFWWFPYINYHCMDTNIFFCLLRNYFTLLDMSKQTKYTVYATNALSPLCSFPCQHRWASEQSVTK